MSKETILFVVSIISVVAAIAMLIFGIYQFRKNRRLEEEKFKYLDFIGIDAVKIGI